MKGFGFLPWLKAKQGRLYNHSQSPYVDTGNMRSSWRPFKEDIGGEGMRSFIKNFCDSVRKRRYNNSKESLAPLKPFRAGYPGMVLQLDCTPGPKHKKPSFERGNSHRPYWRRVEGNAKLCGECGLKSVQEGNHLRMEEFASKGRIGYALGLSIPQLSLQL